MSERESTEALVERVREALCPNWPHPGITSCVYCMNSEDGANAARELAERLEAAERDAETLSDLADALRAERDGLKEQLEAQREAVAKATKLFRSHVYTLSEKEMREQYPDSLGTKTFEWLARYGDDSNPAIKPEVSERDRYGTGDAHPESSTRRVAEYVGGDDEASRSETSDPASSPSKRRQVGYADR